MKNFVLSEWLRVCQWLKSFKYQQLKICLLDFASNPCWSGKGSELCHWILVHLLYYLPDLLCCDFILVMKFSFYNTQRMWWKISVSLAFNLFLSFTPIAISVQIAIYHCGISFWILNYTYNQKLNAIIFK